MDPLYPDAMSPPVKVHVLAPADLPEGYTFEASVNGDPERTFTAEVPPGGVTEGQTFLAALPENYTGERLNIPTGHWKDGLFDCCQYGVCSASLWCAICCPQLLMGQIMQRMMLTWLGEPGPIISTKNSFKVVLTIVVAYFVYSLALEFAAMPYSFETLPAYIPILKTVGSVLFSVWALYALCRTRENIRARYSIPEQSCYGCEDLCCSFWCTCCTVAQVARHTGEYETYPATCCTQTGLPPGAPFGV